MKTGLSLFGALALAVSSAAHPAPAAAPEAARESADSAADSAPDSAAAAANPIVGTWKLNVAKSTFTPGPGWRSQVRTYRATPGGASVSWTGVGASGDTMHVSYDYTYDGKDYPMVGSANYDTLNAVPVDALTVKSEEKRDGKVLTITDEGTNRKGEKFSQVLVFERQ